MRFSFLIGLAILLFVALSEIQAQNVVGDENESQQTNRQLVDVDGQGHENTSGRKTRQFGFGPQFGGFGGPGFSGPGFDGGFGGGFGGGGRERFRYRERFRVRHRSFGGGGFFR